MSAVESGLLCIRKDANIVKKETGFPLPNDDLQLGAGVLSGRRYERLPSSLFMGGEILPPSQSSPLTGGKSVSKGIGNDVSSGFQMLSHEDTDDLEALLSSDEELSSTGHSPYDVFLNNVPKLSNGKNCMVVSLSSGKKRKKILNNYCSDDDAESSTATSAFVGLEYSKDRCLDIDCTVSGTMKSDTFKHCRGTCLGKEATPFSDEMGSRSEHASIRAMHKKVSPERRGPTKRARRTKIRQTFQLLRNVIPEGGTMDAAFVLEEAIQYVKSLQVKVQVMEGKKLI